MSAFWIAGCIFTFIFVLCVIAYIEFMGQK